MLTHQIKWTVKCDVQRKHIHFTHREKEIEIHAEKHTKNCSESIFSLFI